MPPTLSTAGDPALDALGEIQRILDTPLAELVGDPEMQAVAEELTRQALATPALARAHQLIAFVGGGRRATQAGNLTTADAVALAEQLGVDEQERGEARSLTDLPEAAHAFRWSLAAGFVERRGTKLVAGPLARDLERDPLSAWLTTAVTLLEHGLLDGFHQGWRKTYVEFLDASAAGLLAALAEAGGPVPLATIEDRGWEQVAAAYGHQPDDDSERQNVARLIRAMVAQLADIGAVVRHSDEVVLTELGSALAAITGFSAEDDDLNQLDLVDTDAQSLLLVCVEMEPADATEHLRAWCRAHSAGEAAAELCEAMLDDDDPDVWQLGLEALGMIDPRAAEPAVGQLRSHPGLRPLATEWLRRRSEHASDRRH